MAISAGTPTFLGISGQNPAGQAYNVPATAKALAFFGGSTGGGNLSTLTLAAVAFSGSTFATDSDRNAVVRYFLAPPTGSQTLDWAWAGTPADGGAVWVVPIIADGDVSFVDSDADCAAETGATASSSSASGDLAVACGFEIDSAASVSGSSYAALAANSSFNAYHARPYSVLASGASVSGTSQVGFAQIVFREGAAPPAGNVTPDTSRSRGVRGLTGVGLRPRRYGAIWSFPGVSA